MKKNNKGFVVSAVLYPLLVLFLALIMGLLAMTDTRKRILDKMKLEISDSIFDEATCSCDTILNKLNYIIKNGVGGGGGGSYTQNTLGLDVKNYEDPSSMPNVGNGIGDIAVITDVEITNYYVSSTEPVSPKHGTVWVVQTRNSEYFITSDYSKIGINYAMQYICDEAQTACEWQLKKSYVYDDAKWNLLYYVPVTNSELDLTGSDINAQIVHTYDYTGEYQEFHAQFSGYYQVELWGAQGAALWVGGKGAYTSGEIYLNAGETLYVYVGGAGSGYTGGWNGGGSGANWQSGTDRRYGYGGGGATDVRLVPSSLRDSYDDFDSLKSRIMVAGGGGGDSHRYYTNDGNYYSRGYGGNAGGLIGYNGYTGASNNGWGVSGEEAGTGATQSLAGFVYNNWSKTASFGKGQSNAGNGGSGGGGGWYGGGSSSNGGTGAGGGSSYISGHDGCDSIDKNSTEDNIIHVGSSHYYDNYWFKNTTMIDGAGYKWEAERVGSSVGMPTHDGSSLMTGNSGNGYAKITLKTIEYHNDERIVKDREDSEVNWSFSYTGSNKTTGKYQIFTAPVSGTYQAEAWGAQGSALWVGGKGAYTSGDIYLEKNQKLYIYVGSSGYYYTGGWNGGGSGANWQSETDRRYGYGGGGATDIRLVSTSTMDTWNEFDSLKSRIMVAGGGGGDSHRYYTNDGNYYSRGYGGNAGGLDGYNGYTGASNNGWGISGENAGTGGSQAYAGYIYNDWGKTASFGIGQSNAGAGGSGGGGGYYGGGSSSNGGTGAGGGSSYISGHNGSNSIDESSIPNNLIHIGSKYHYSGYYFINTHMIDGAGYDWEDSKKDIINQPTIGKSTVQSGKTGDGYAKITLKSRTNQQNSDVLEDTWNYKYAGTTITSGKYQIFEAPQSGMYKIQAWGAQGRAIWTGGKGAYTSGEIYLEKGKKLYIYVGSAGWYHTGGWNGGGNGSANSDTDRRYGYGGGGATDIRLVNTSSPNVWNEFDSLKTRIMVAAGGGGDAYRYNTGNSSGYYSNGYGGNAGGLNGYEGYVSACSNWCSGDYRGIGGTQSLPGYINNVYQNTATFGGGSSTISTGAGGGGGYYGGSTSYIGGAGGAGGSSYISGHNGSNSIDELSSETNLIHTGSKYHYSGYYFSNTQMIDGSGYEWTTYRKTQISMPNISNVGTTNGNSGNGYVRIQFINHENNQEENVTETDWNYSYAGMNRSEGNYQIFTAPKDGLYKMEAWGAQGGAIWSGGLGGYTSGEIYLTKGTKLYMYVGSTGNGQTGGWNGGGNGSANSDTDRRYGYGGGGATDIRLVNTSSPNVWNEFDSLKSRIMVAAGGGGDSHRYNTGNSSGYYSNGYGGTAGGLSGNSGYINGCSNWCSSGHQGVGAGPSSAGYEINNTGYAGKFGIGQSTNSTGGGGGGGYYGGGAAYIGGIGGGGGSSYISGHEGVNSISEDSTSLEIIHNGSKYHYSGYYFDNTNMVDGSGYQWSNKKESKTDMPTKDGTSTMTGNSGHGYIKVHLVSTGISGKQDEEVLRENEINKYYYYSGVTQLSGSYQVLEIEKSGKYQIELWGAQGAAIWNPGEGGYTKGVIDLTKGTKLYIYVGSIGRGYTGGWNGGGSGSANSDTDRRYGYGGGGATDIRVVASEWNETSSLKSRIMVAAGGGGDAYRYHTGNSGGYYSNGYGGNAGGLTGNSGYINACSNWCSSGHQGVGATQTLPGYSASVTSATGGFGYGGTTTSTGAGGGGGWYGGGASYIGGVGGAGGSSYISGHAGCIGIDDSGNPLTETYSDLSDSYSYTGYKFVSTVMIDGSGYNWTTEKGALVYQPTNDGTSTQTGQSGNGFAKVTYIGV